RAIYNFDGSVTSGITLNLVNHVNTETSSDTQNGNDSYQSIEAVRGTNFADTFVATNFGAVGFTSDTSQYNVGSSGTFNEFEGVGGNDSITGNGNTRIAFYNSGGSVTVDLAAGTAVGDTSVGTDT